MTQPASTRLVTEANLANPSSPAGAALSATFVGTLPDTTVAGASGQLAAGVTSNVAAGGTYTSPALDAVVATPPKRWAIKAASTSGCTITLPDAAGATAATTLLAGEALTFRQKSTLGWGVESGNKPLVQLDARFAGLTNGIVPDAYLPQAVTAVRARPPVRGNLSVVTTFQTGHGWSVTGTGATSNLNDTTDYVLGSQSLRGISGGGGIATSIRRTGLPNVDLTDKAIRILVKITNLSKLASMQCYVGSSAFVNFYTIPVYNPADGKTIREGEWTWLEFNFNGSGLATTGGGTPAKTTITDWQLRWTDDGTGPVTIQANAIGFVPQPAVFPNGVVSIACDDSYDSQFNVMAPILDKYGFPATAYLICDQIGQPGAMTLAQTQALQDLHGWEMAAHAYAATVHNATFTGVTASALEADLRAMKHFLLANDFGRYETLAYPLGQANPAVEQLVARYFSLARTVVSVPENTQAPGDLMKMRSKSVSNLTTTAQLQTIVDNAYANKNWSIITFHKITASPTVSTEFATASFQTFVDYLATKGIPVRPVGEVLTLIRA